jgi:hypothetical protein
VARTFNGTDESLTNTTFDLEYWSGALSGHLWAANDGSGTSCALFSSTSTGSYGLAFNYETYNNTGKVGITYLNVADYASSLAMPGSSGGYVGFSQTTGSGSGTGYCYVNGVQSNAISLGTVRTDGGVIDGLFIGGIKRAATAYSASTQAELALWDAVLTPAEFAALGKGMCPLLIRPSSLILYVPMIRGVDGSTGDERDLVGGASFAQANNPTVAAHPRVIYPRRRSIIVPTSAPASSPVPILMHHYRMQRVN